MKPWVAEKLDKIAELVTVHGPESMREGGE